MFFYSETENSKRKMKDKLNMVRCSFLPLAVIKHEPLAREIAQALPVLLTLNKFHFHFFPT